MSNGSESGEISGTPAPAQTTPQTTPANISISGVVTDGAGQAVRGAIVKVSSGTKSISRYTDSAGQYRIAGLASGQYEITVDAFGFAIATQNADTSAGQVNFTLSPQNDLGRLSSAEVRFLLPTADDKEVLRIYTTCASCHGMETIVPRAGMPEAAWAGFLPYMTAHRFGDNNAFTPERSALLAPMVAKIFGPEGLLGPKANIDFSKVKYTPVKDAALKATITEYSIPGYVNGTPAPKVAMPHSVTVDDSNGIVWFSEYDALTNNIARFDPVTEKFAEYPVPVPHALAHTGDVLEDGRFVVALDRGEVPTKLIIASPDGTLEPVEWAEKSQGARVVEVDPTDGDVVWIIAEDETWRYNVRTKEFKAYKNPVPDTFPEGSYGARIAGPDRQQPSPNGYDLTVDSKGIPWVTQIDPGIIFRIDPETGETTSYHTPEMVSARGIEVDTQDNLWFADFHGNQLGMLNQKTGEIKLYQPPNPYAAPYGITIDKRRGYVWYPDTHANNLTRFDPKTEEFVEYPLPTQNSSVRFNGVDPHGRAWYGGFWTGKLGVIDPGDEDSNLLSAH